MNSAGGQGRDSGSGFRRSLLAWALWVLASTVGGALGGVTFIMQFFGVLFLFGIVLGAAQALVLVRYLPLGFAVAGAWMGTSFCGWLGGWVVVYIEQTDGSGLGGEAAGAVVWAALATLQGVALALLVTLTLGWRSLLLVLVPLWVVTGVLGGALAMLAGSYLSDTFDRGASGGSLIGQLVPVVVEQAAAGGIYGISTGLALAMLVKWLDERRSTGVATDT